MAVAAIERFQRQGEGWLRLRRRWRRMTGTTGTTGTGTIITTTGIMAIGAIITGTTGITIGSRSGIVEQAPAGSLIPL